MAKRLNKTEKKLFILCLAFLSVYVCFQWVYKPLKGKIDDANRRIMIQQKRLRKNLRMIQKAKRIGEAYKLYFDQFKQTKTNEEVMSAILSEIEEVAGGLELKISELKPKRVKRDDEIQQFSVSLTIDSQFMNILEFLYLLQSDKHFFDVEEVRFDKTSLRGGTAIKTRLVLSKFFIRSK